MATNPLFITKGFNGYGVEYSPFMEDRIAAVSAANYGIVGNGRLWILRHMNPQQPLGLEVFYDTQDGLFDCAWSEIHENQLVTSSGDGSIKLWDLSVRDYPVRNWTEHTKEVYSVHWNLVRKDRFISGSWDLSIKLWDPNADKSLATWTEHQHCIYQTIWSPSHSDLFASASGDMTVKIWDTRQSRSVFTLRAHNHEILALDWSKYHQDTIVTGSVDTSIKIWDLRQIGLSSPAGVSGGLAREVNTLMGHGYAVRRLKCSPHAGNMIASTSYDMSMRVWDINTGSTLFIQNDHTEFVFGLDFSLFVPGRIATCGWDESVRVAHI